MEKEQLLALGLSRREAEVYLVLLQTEDASASAISRKTQESRTNTYDTLNSLIKKGLVSYVAKGAVKYFMASHPKKLLDWVSLKKAEIEKEEKLVEKLIPDLAKLRKPTEKKVVVEVYEGVEGIRTVLRETIDACMKGNKEMLAFNAIPGYLRKLDPIYHKKYYEERKRLGIKGKYIFIEGESYPKASDTEYRFLPKQFKSFAATTIHGDEVSFWPVTKPMIIILVKSKELADTYRSNFAALWKMAK